ncbi:hypothetical protein Drorol1_Dr00026649 [Drosera rotundifolia]
MNLPNQISSEYDSSSTLVESSSPTIPSDSHYKLCGFLRTVVKPDAADAAVDLDNFKALEFGTRCHTFSNGTEIGFKTDTGVVLTQIVEEDDSENDGKAETESTSRGVTRGRKSKRGRGDSAAKRRVKRKESSVVEVVHGLVMSKCVKVDCRVIAVPFVGEARVVVVLVDVYLPIGVWTSGWQFPKSAAKAAQLFRHLSCNWEERSSILQGDKKCYVDGDLGSQLTLPDCHVLGCKDHYEVGSSSRKKLFELHEIFKSIPSLGKEGKSICSRIEPNVSSSTSGIWDLTDDILVPILGSLCPQDLLHVSFTCRHLRLLSASIMPCIKLKLFPHQLAAVEWMLQREKNPCVYPHPLYKELLTEDNFPLHINIISGELLTGVAPIITDFRGGLFCDEPGLGKTITALSLILKTQGALADPPHGVHVIWCTPSDDRKWGYYECRGHRAFGGTAVLPGHFSAGQGDRRGQFSLEKLIPKGMVNCSTPTKEGLESAKSHSWVTGSSCPIVLGMTLEAVAQSTPASDVATRKWNMGQIKKNFLYDYADASSYPNDPRTYPRKRKNDLCISRNESLSFHSRRQRKEAVSHFLYNDTWVQCEACRKWRKIFDGSEPDATVAWFCSMNADPLFQSCKVPEESWDSREPITHLPGFCSKGTLGGLAENVSFFTSVLQEHYALMDSQTKKALTWLARLSPEKLAEMETFGLICPCILSTGEAHRFHKLFKAFGLVRKVVQGVNRWIYPHGIGNLVFDLVALRTALCKPLDLIRVYLSRATLVVVPSNLVDHWKSQIQKHVNSGQLKVYVWTDHKKPLAHDLAWGYDVVITTFNRLSVEWSPNKRSLLMQVHWLRVILDEGHTLGSSLNLTNKLQMVVSLIASSRWVLTGTPTPNTPNSQLSHLQLLLKFLHEKCYGQNPKLWDAGIVKPFEAEMEEGRDRLLQLLSRCMISARKADLQCIPPCFKKSTYLNFTEEHAKSYNELVVTVRRNILMADWNDPSHVESLLNPKQWKFRGNTIRNVRLSCCVAGHIKVAHAGQDIQETMDILAESGLDPLSEEYAFIKYSISYGGHCQRCNQWCRLPVITPCRHLLCLDCVALDSERCTFPSCNNPYEMQAPDSLTRPENPNPKWPVPKDLIELQPSYKQDTWDPDWQSTSSSKVSYLVQRLKEIQVACLQPICQTSKGSDAERDEGILSLSHESSRDSFQYGACSDSCEAPFEKVIIFSQFLEHIHVIEQQLSFAGIKFARMYSPMQSSHKMKSLTIFQQDANCMALLMDGSAALGLDLSFVTHVFLMEPIWDRSMEEQVISRAHRMGATRPINVETLAMRGTIEDQMLEFLQNDDEFRKLLKEHSGKQEHENAKAHRSLHDFAEKNYLAHLSTVRTSQNT